MCPPKYSRSGGVIFGVLLWLVVATATGQSISPDSLLSDSTTAPLPADTTLSQPVPDSVVIEPVMNTLGDDTLLVAAFAAAVSDTFPKMSPTVTMFKSVVFPGWGQFCNRKYLKAGLVFAVESYFIYKSIHFASKASDWRTRWKNTPDSLSDEKKANFTKYADYRDSRNSGLWATAVTIFLSMFDAYVDAHLRHFPATAAETKALSWDIDPASGPNLSIIWRF